ncbi:endo alpha-1,4 polygalactosaminidase [Streptomyces sp. SP18BB07]|uniref:endo alpha-1,4 polygalactosaminidase n=1 Tax=Streptomyces sp. SP18BB07 TaxID=3002522 RepID=UPI003FCCC0F6
MGLPDRRRVHPAGRRAGVSRSYEDPAAPGAYNICNFNALQAQEDAEDDWDPDLLLRDADGKVVRDEEWKEAVLDIRTAAKRERVASRVNGWIDGCAAKGYQAVEPDNYDTFTRFPDHLTAGQAKAFMKLLSAHAHAKGPAVWWWSGGEGRAPAVVRSGVVEWAV